MADAISIQTVSKIMKARREELGLSQRQVGEMVGLKNPNFVSMLEKGNSGIPASKIAAIVGAYELDNIMAVMMALAHHEDLFESFRAIFAMNPEVVNMKRDDIVEYVNKQTEGVQERYAGKK